MSDCKKCLWVLLQWNTQQKRMMYLCRQGHESLVHCGHFQIDPYFEKADV